MQSYNNMDYIIIQSEALRPYFDSALPHDKLQALGSPKFDRVIQMCQNPPKIPNNWKNKMRGKTVYFFNTSLSGLLNNTDQFLQKMRYVFENFKGKDNACLLWRPHPLLEATLKAMRPENLAAFNEIKQYFIENDIGIYDDTPDVDKSIALSDVYIGSFGSSVISLFGVAGKPIFILNNYITELPHEDDWKGSIIKLFEAESKDWLITQGNKLYHRDKDSFHYRFYCDLSENVVGDMYSNVFEVAGKVYVCPLNALDILIVDENKIERRIQLAQPKDESRFPMFNKGVHVGNYIFLLPIRYPALVRYDIQSGQVDYIQGFNKCISVQAPPTWICGGNAIWNDYILFASPVAREMFIININTLAVQKFSFPQTQLKGGFSKIIADGDTLWLLPYFDKSITRLNMKDGSVNEYTDMPAGFECRHLINGGICNERPFASGICDENEVFLAPNFGNMFVRLDKKTGQIKEWKTPFNVPAKEKNSYFAFKYYWINKGVFSFEYMQDKSEIFFFQASERQYYNFDLATKTFNKIDVSFDENELRQQSHGFGKLTQGHPYACMETEFQTLTDLIENKLLNNPFDKQAQLNAYSRVNVNMMGTAGNNIYKFIKEKLNQ